MVRVTEAALDYFSSLQGSVVLSVNNKGCSGHSYNLYVTDNITDNLQKVEDNFYVDTNYKDLLDGSVVDYKQDKLYSSLVIINPNEQSRCGCGESFA